MYLSDELFQHSWVLFLCLFLELQSDEENKHKNNTQVSAETVCQLSTDIILFLTWHSGSIKDDKNDDIYTSSVSYSLGLHSADDVTIDGWWHHTNETFE